MENLNQKLYTTELLNDWGTREEIIEAESYLINKYLTNKAGKVIEAGTGGGRLAFYVEKMGFGNVEAFDYVPGMIVNANERKGKINSTVEFKVADATNLALYADNSFDYLIYLQQVLCFIEDEQLFYNALKETYRIAKNANQLNSNTAKRSGMLYVVCVK